MSKSAKQIFKTLGWKIQKLRKETKMSQEEFAYKLGISRVIRASCIIWIIRQVELLRQHCSARHVAQRECHQIDFCGDRSLDPGG